MGQKTNPIGFRLPVRRNWESRWYASKKDFPALLAEDYKVREFLMKKLKAAAVPRIFIERAGSRVRVKIFTARPGVVIGRKGQEMDVLKKDLSQLVKREVLLDVQEVRKPDLVAYLVAESVALQLERRISFRRAIKKAVGQTMQMGAQGVRIQVSGRLGGSDIARREWTRTGRVPLHTLRENIDFGFAEAQTVWGKIGVKAWVCLAPDERPLG